MKKENKMDIDYLMVIAEDTKKEITYSKCSGEWYWNDRGDNYNYGPHETFTEAVKDAVEPYLIESE